MIVLRRPFDVVGDEQIEPAVFVVIEPSRAGGPSAFIRDTSFRGDVGESAVAVVVIEDGAAVASHVEIGIAVVVEVADGDSLAVVAFAADAGFFSDVGESSVAVVVIKRAAQWMRRLVDIGGGGLDEVEIHQAILVIVEPGDSSAHGFEIILFVGGVHPAGK